MKRALLLAAAGIAAIAVVLPATAGAASFTGVVIAKKQARHAVVTASKNGVVRTTRVRGALGRYRIGRHVFVRGAVLPDGTYAASKIRMLGPKARGVRVHGSVVWATAKQLVVSAGASVFSLALRGGTLAPSASGGLQPGDDLDLSADVKGGALQTSADRLHKTGHSDELVLEGIYLATADDGTIELAVVHRGRVFVNVPGDLFVPEFKAGDVIALKVKVEADGSFTLVKADDESGGGDGDGDHIGKHQFSVNGVLSSIDDNNVSVSAGDGDSKTVTCAVPDGFDLSGYEVGQRVVMTCKYDDGKPVLVALQKKESGGEKKVFPMPIFCLHEGKFTTQYSRTFVEAAQKLPEVPRMTRAHDEALDLHAEVCEELCFTMDFLPGDLQLLNNHVAYHGRTHYEDGDGAAGDRLLLRLWVAPPNSRALPPSYLPIWGTTAPGVPRGGITQPA